MAVLFESGISLYLVVAMDTADDAAGIAMRYLIEGESPPCIYI
jgi:hypothetical protein